MSSKKSDTPDSNGEHPIQVVAELLANAIGQIRGLHGAELDASVDSARDKAQAVVANIEKQVESPETRERMAEELRKMIALFANVGGTLAEAMAVRSAPIQKAIAGADIHKPAEALRLLAEYLQNPTPDREAAMKAKVSEIEVKAGGGSVSEDEVKAELKRSLDSIFKKTK